MIDWLYLLAKNNYPIRYCRALS